MKEKILSILYMSAQPPKQVVFSNGKGTQARGKPPATATVPMATATQYNRGYGSVGALSHAFGQMTIKPPAKGGKKKTRKSLKKRRKTRRL